jgi:TetR/AcrR family transcriptional regulator
MDVAPGRRPSGRPRSEDSPASLDNILGAALKAFATQGYDGVALRTLNRELGVSHNALNGRFGSKEALWYATIDWAFQPLVLRLATAFDPTVTDPLDQLRITMRSFLEYSAKRPELLGLMNIEGRQDTGRLAYLYDSYIQPALAPVHRLLDHLAAIGRTRPISLRTFNFFLAHGAAAQFTLGPLARHFDPARSAGPGSSQGPRRACRGPHRPGTGDRPHRVGRVWMQMITATALRHTRLTDRGTGCSAQRGFEVGAEDGGNHRVGDPRVAVSLNAVANRAVVADRAQVIDESFTDGELLSFGIR